MTVELSDKAGLANYADKKKISDIEKFTINKKNFELVDYYSNSYNGYQGYAYKYNGPADKENKKTYDEDVGKIYIVHAGSNDLSTFENIFTKESLKDWVITDTQLLFDKIPSQYYSAEYFLNNIREEYNNDSNENMEQIGQSLGGTIANMLGMLKENQDIPVYAFNTLGSATMERPLLMKGYELSNDYSNINNYSYTNELVTKIKNQVGNVFEAQYIETAPPTFHSLKTYTRKEVKEYIEKNLEEFNGGTLQIKITEKFLEMALTELESFVDPEKLFIKVLERTLFPFPKMDGAMDKQLFESYKKLYKNSFKYSVFIMHPEALLVKNLIETVQKTKGDPELLGKLKDYIRHTIPQFQYAIYLQHPELFAIKQIAAIHSPAKENADFQLEIEHNEYVVKSGDTISDIAKRYDISVDELLNLNPWLRSRYSEDKSTIYIHPGELLTLPEENKINCETLSGTEAAHELDKFSARRSRKTKKVLKRCSQQVRDYLKAKDKEASIRNSLPPGFEICYTHAGKPYYTDGRTYYIRQFDLHEEIEYVFQEGLEDLITRLGYERHDYS